MRRQVAGVAVDPQHREIGALVLQDDVGGELALVGERHLDLVGLRDDVEIGDDEAGGVDDARRSPATAARACSARRRTGRRRTGGRTDRRRTARRLPLDRARGVDVDHRRRDALDDRRERKLHLGGARRAPAAGAAARSQPPAAPERDAGHHCTATRPIHHVGSLHQMRRRRDTSATRTVEHHKIVSNQRAGYAPAPSRTRHRESTVDARLHRSRTITKCDRRHRSCIRPLARHGVADEVVTRSHSRRCSFSNCRHAHQHRHLRAAASRRRSARQRESVGLRRSAYRGERRLRDWSAWRSRSDREHAPTSGASLTVAAHAARAATGNCRHGWHGVCHRQTHTPDRCCDNESRPRIAKTSTSRPRRRESPSASAGNERRWRSVGFGAQRNGTGDFRRNDRQI